MTLVLNSGNINIENIHFLEPKKNIIIDGNFTKILYADDDVSINGIYILCPIVFNNIPRPTNAGYTVPNQQICDKNDYQNMNQNNSMRGYDNNTLKTQYATLNTFIDNNKPLFNGGTEKVKL